MAFDQPGQQTSDICFIRESIPLQLPPSLSQRTNDLECSRQKRCIWFHNHTLEPSCLQEVESSSRPRQVQWMGSARHTTASASQDRRNKQGFQMTTGPSASKDHPGYSSQPLKLAREVRRGVEKARHRSTRLQPHQGSTLGACICFCDISS